jgi:hypothetical protein
MTDCLLKKMVNMKSRQKKKAAALNVDNLEQPKQLVDQGT